MYSRTLLAMALLVAPPIASSADTAEESAPVHAQEIPDPASSRDVATMAMEAHAVSDNLQAARKADELPFSEIKILPSF